LKELLKEELQIIKDPDYQQRILIFDIENSPLLSYNWGIWEQNAVEVKEEWYILCFAYKWLGEKDVHIVSLPDFRGYKQDKKNDYKVVKELWKLFDKADVLIAHNGNSFDIKKANARFLIHGLEPPTPYKSIDTLTIARKHFKLDSNKLDDLGQYLKLGRKLPHTGKHLWFGCMEGDPKSWDLMKRYNIQDVVLLEKVYLKLRGWDTNQQVNMNMVLNTISCCPRCGAEHIIKAGFKYTATCIYQTYKCLNCGARPQGEKVGRPKPEFK
jgi:hypothetical protein